MANFGVGGYSLNLSFFCLFFIFYFLVNFLLIIMKIFLLNIQSPFFLLMMLCAIEVLYNNYTKLK